MRVRTLLGSAADGQVTIQLGVGSEAVRKHRTAAGIPAYSLARWTSAVIMRMGSVPDRVIADEIGVDRSAVAWQRQQRGIALG